MDPARPLVSVVIPCYNQAQYLGEAIGSARAREVEVEIIVVDDGSTDGTADVAARFSGVTLIRQDNRGLAAARNRGLAAAEGGFVIFLDADDRMMPGGIDIAAQALLAHVSCAMAYGRCVMIGPDGVAWPTPSQAIVSRDHYGALLRNNLIWMPAMAIFRRDALQRIDGFREGFDAAADYDLYLRMAREWPVHDHGALVAAYRRHPASMSGSAMRMLGETLTVMRRHRPAAARAGQSDNWRRGYATWQTFYGTQLVEEIRAHLRSGQVREALRKGSFLATRAPRLFAREIGRKIRATFYAGRAIPAAEISSPRRRAEN